MKHGKKSSSSVHAFTLLEVILAVGIAALVMSVGLVVVSSSSQEQELKGRAREIRDLAKYVRYHAKLGGKVGKIILNTDQLKTVIPKRPREKAEDIDGFDDEPEAAEVKDKVLQLGKSMVLKVKTLEMRAWKKPEDFSWQFSPSGVCEPMSIRLENDSGWIEFSMSPLTAEIVDESYEIR